MDLKNNIKKIEEIIEEFFEKMDFTGDIEIKQDNDSTISISLNTETPQILIGEKGQTLAEIQHLLKRILRKKIVSDDIFYVNFDINNYKKRKQEYLINLAESAADKVSLSKKEEILEPMSAYERRIIHLQLAQRADVETESIGGEPERTIKIKPILPAE
ncbi:MAG: R3H domain-containing nucleic acid-binding protein [Patescibacteria group bacterium]|nr:R3H domain-containing nucleic acid-binding protein [Patescibacteria group bacterium]